MRTIWHPDCEAINGRPWSYKTEQSLKKTSCAHAVWISTCCTNGTKTNPFWKKHKCFKRIREHEDIQNIRFRRSLPLISSIRFRLSACEICIWSPVVLSDLSVSLKSIETMFMSPSCETWSFQCREGGGLTVSFPPSSSSSRRRMAWQPLPCSHSILVIRERVCKVIACLTYDTYVNCPAFPVLMPLSGFDTLCILKYFQKNTGKKLAYVILTRHIHRYTIWWFINVSMFDDICRENLKMWTRVVARFRCKRSCHERLRSSCSSRAEKLQKTLADLEAHQISKHNTHSCIRCVWCIRCIWCIRFTPFPIISKPFL